MLSLPHARVWLAAGWLLIGLVIFFSLVPHVPTLNVGVSDKLEHFVSYFLLMGWFSGLYPRERHLQLAVAFFMMGGALELLQGVLTTTRDMDLADAITNGAGVATALVFARLGLANWTSRVESVLTRKAGAGEKS